ncbi:MAG: PH domain-containing protein [Bowdeniella nasicola]|nr:PH domain-containing protein [Bowdeniella nasicola]
MSENALSGELARDAAEVHWSKVHPLTPLINAAKALTVLLALLTWQAVDAGLNTLPILEQDAQASGVVRIAVLIIVALVIVVLAIGGAFFYLSWRYTKYAIGEEAVYFHKGIIFRSQRHARLNRVQAVDLVRPLLARFVGLAAVEIESAGGSDSNVRITYLREDEAEAVRNEILARAAGVQGTPVEVPGRATDRHGAPTAGHEGAAATSSVPSATPGAGSDDPGAPAVRPVAEGTPRLHYAAAPEREVLTVPPGRLLASIAISPWTFLLLVAIVAIVIAALSWSALVFAALPALAPALLVVGVTAWSRLAGEFGFTLAISPDGLRSRHGLTETRATTIPPRRIQAVQVTQPILWRIPGWWRVEINVAGYHTSDSSSNKTSTSAVKNVVLPVGERTDLERVLWLIVPDLGVDDPAEVLDALLEGSGEGAGFYTAPRQARWLDWFTWRRHGLYVTRTALLMRSGFFVRRSVLVPHSRTQSLALEQGPLERLLHLANLAAHSVPGPVGPRARHLPEDIALEILLAQAERARMARTDEGPEEWMRRASSVAS